MCFEERELKPHAESVPPEELKNGETYVAVLFLDDDGLVPALEPLVSPGEILTLEIKGSSTFRIIRRIFFPMAAVTRQWRVLQVYWRVRLVRSVRRGI
jgi:hypothetical protein